MRTQWFLNSWDQQVSVWSLGVSMPHLHPPHTQQLVGSPFASEVMTSSTCLLCMLYMWKLAFFHIIGTSFAYVHYLHAVYIWYICILFLVLELKFNKMDQWVKSSR